MEQEALLQKISKFIEFSQKIKKIGIPLDQNQRQNIVLLDRWPLLTATALDCLGLGFFTMNHEIVDISKDLENIYHRIDIGTILSLINAKTEFLENTYTDFINHVQKEPINKRLNIIIQIGLIKMKKMVTMSILFQHLFSIMMIIMKEIDYLI